MVKSGGTIIDGDWCRHRKRMVSDVIGAPRLRL